MSFDDILEFLFHKISGFIVMVSSVAIGVLVMSGCAPLDLWGCMCYAMCSDESCGDSCINCSDSWDTCMYNTLTCHGENDCTWVDCVYGNGCESKCGDCYTDCGGCDLSLYQALFCTDAFCPSCSKPEGYRECTYGNCTMYCNGIEDPESPIYKKIYLFNLPLMNADGTPFTTFELYENTKTLPAPSVEYMQDFKGYFTMQGGQGVQITNSSGSIVTMPDSSSPIYAHVTHMFEGVKFNLVTIDPDGNTASTNPVYYGDDISTLIATFPERAGYDVIYTASIAQQNKIIGKNGTVYSEYLIFDPVQHGFTSTYLDSGSTVQVTASYVPKTFTVTVTYPDGTSAQSVLEFGEQLYSVTPKEIQGKIFAGYAEYAEADITDLIPEDATITSNSTVYAIYTDIVTVILGGVEYNYYEGQTVTLPEPATIPVGCEFAGWEFDNKSLGYNVYTELTIEAFYNGATMSPAWRNASYKITYYSGDSKVGEETYSYGDTRVIGFTHTKPFYTFGGWYSNENLTGAKVTEITATTHGDLTLYAKYLPKTYTVTLDPQGGSISGYEKTLTYSESFTLPKPSRVGKEFLGWYYYGPTGEKVVVTDGNGVSKFTFDAENLVGKSTEAAFETLNLIAEYKTCEYTVKFMIDGTVYNTVTVAHGNRVSAPTSPDVKGYEFLGWKTEGGEYYDFNTELTGNLTLTAELEAKTYVITLMVRANEGSILSGGEEYTEIQIIYTYGDTSVDLSGIVPQHDGFIFTGWYSGNGLLCISTNGSVLLGNLKQILNESGETVLYAHWS